VPFQPASASLADSVMPRLGLWHCVITAAVAPHCPTFAVSPPSLSGTSPAAHTGRLINTVPLRPFDSAPRPNE
jgi:hypothetical protein